MPQKQLAPLIQVSFTESDTVLMVTLPVTNLAGLIPLIPALDKEIKEEQDADWIPLEIKGIDADALIDISYRFDEFDGQDLHDVTRAILGYATKRTSTRPYWHLRIEGYYAI